MTDTQRRAEIEAEIAEKREQVGIREYELEAHRSHLAALETELAGLGGKWTGSETVWLKGTLMSRPCANEEYGANVELDGVERKSVDDGGLWVKESVLHRSPVPAVEGDVELPEWMGDRWQADFSELAAAWGASKTMNECVKTWKPLMAFLARTAPAPAPKVGEPEMSATEHARHIAEWYAENDRTHLFCWPITIAGNSYNVTVAPHDPSGSLTPPVAVAGKGVVERINLAVTDMLALPYDSDAYKAAKRMLAALAEIVTLPEPSEGAKHQVDCWIADAGGEWEPSFATELAAALIQSALTAPEVEGDGK